MPSRPECEWCHSPLSEEAERSIAPLLAMLGPTRARYVEDTWGKVPEEMCARDFMELLGQTNAATFTSP
jgi:hypothetical protein